MLTQKFFSRLLTKVHEYRVTAAVVLIFTAFFIDLAGGRWGSYLRIPIECLYLPDAFQVLGVLLGIRTLITQRSAPRFLAFAVVLSATYVSLHLVGAALTGGTGKPYLFLRDHAPFV